MADGIQGPQCAWEALCVYLKTSVANTDAKPGGVAAVLIPFCIQDDIEAARRRRRRLTACKLRSRRRAQQRCRLNANWNYTQFESCYTVKRQKQVHSNKAGQRKGLTGFRMIAPASTFKPELRYRHDVRRVGRQSAVSQRDAEIKKPSKKNHNLISFIPINTEPFRTSAEKLK